MNENRRCPNCKEELGAEDKFCVKCGSRIDYEITRISLHNQDKEKGLIVPRNRTEFTNPFLVGSEDIKKRIIEQKMKPAEKRTSKIVFKEYYGSVSKEPLTEAADEVEPIEEEPIEVEPIEEEPIEVEPIEEAPTEEEPIEEEPTEVEPTEVEPTEVEPIEVEPIEDEPTEVEPIEEAPTEEEPIEEEPTEVEPIEVEPIEVEPIEVEPIEVEIELIEEVSKQETTRRPNRIITKPVGGWKIK